MIGYLIFDPNYIAKKAASKAIDKLITFRLLKNLTTRNTEIFFIKNQHVNNYILENENALLCATGTFIYQGLRGNEALQLLMERLNYQENILNVYADFRGHYNLIHVNKLDSETSIYTDKEGLQSGFVSSQNGRTAFSSSLLLLASLLDSSLDEIALREFIHIGACMEWRTLFKNLKKMQAGTRYSKVKGKWRQDRLWRISVKYPYLSDTDKDIIHKTSSMLMNDLKVTANMKARHLVSDLTGGTDTRTVLSFLLKYHNNLTVSTAGPSNHIDVIISKRIANKLGLTHYWYQDMENQEVSHNKVAQAIEIADGNINPFHLLKSLPYFEEKARRFKIIFGGNGGPLFKDHYWLFEFNRISRMREPNWQRIANLAVNDYPAQDRLLTNQKDGIYSHLAQMFLNHSKRIVATNNQKLDYVYFDLKCAGFHAPQFSLTNQFLDVYHPLMNGDIVEYMLNIKPDIRKRNVLQFTMIYHNNNKLAWIRTDNECPAVPSTGKFAFLRIYVSWRYFRAFLRKFYTLVIQRNFVRPVHSLNIVAEQLRALGYFEMLKYDKLNTAPLFSEKELSSVLSNPNAGSNLTYILNILAVELFIKRVEQLGNKSISL